MRKPIAYLGIFAAAATFATSSVVQAADDKASPESFLVVQHADAATLKDGMLVLDGADAQVVVFADRPHRATGIIPLAKLVETWGKGTDNFAENPPNAALIGQSEGDPVSLIVELQDPILTGDTLTFAYTLLDGQKATSIDQPYMVIDDCAWCINLGDQFCAAGLSNGLCNVPGPTTVPTSD